MGGYRTKVGTEGDDRLEGSTGRDSITGLGGDDLIIGNGGKDWMHGGDGDDTVRGGDDQDFIYGEDGADRLIGGGRSDFLFGGAGGDTLIGGAQNDRLYATDFASVDTDAGDSLDGGSGQDWLSAGSGDTALGGSGEDSIFGAGGEGGLFDGGAGTDSLGFRVSEDTIYVGDMGFLNQRSFTFDGAQIQGFEVGSIGLGGGDDVVTLAKHVRGFSVSGGDGDDHLVGNGGNDALFAGAGHDTLEGGRGNDSLYGVEATTNALFIGGDGDDYISSYGSGTMQGGAGDDRIIDASGLLEGDGGDDLLSGSGTLDGGAGQDTLESAGEGNLLVGGGGLDTYRMTYNSAEGRHGTVIHDASIARVDLSQIDADRTVKLNQAFTLVEAFNGQAGELTVAYDAGDGMTHVAGDTNGDGAAEFLLLITGDHTDPSLYVL